MVAAMTTTDQPNLVPVLQIHSPIATTTQTVSGQEQIMPQPPLAVGVFALINFDQSMTGDPSVNANSGQWVQRAENEEVNVYFVAGNTPSRSRVDYTTSISSNSIARHRSNTTALINTGSSVGRNQDITTAETGGGLNNFIRLLENWRNKNLVISGGFIQNTKSNYSTAPFSSTAPYSESSQASSTSDIQTLFINPYDERRARQPLSGFRKVYQSETIQSVPYYSPPKRLWGFDVGLLTQPADRFAERFASPLPGANEFLREVNVDDPYINALLCAVQPTDYDKRFGTVPTDYTDYVLGSDKPENCDVISPNSYPTP
jgi:hypothetical protein